MMPGARQIGCGGKNGHPMPPRFSICIPVRNERLWLERTVDSVLAQTDGDFELVLGDNASDDGTAEVIARFDDPRIVRHHFDELVPVNQNFNRTVDLCRSDWIVPMSADDVMRPGCIAALRSAIDAYAADAPSMVCGSVTRVDLEGRPDDLGIGDEGTAGTIRYRPIGPGLHDASSWLKANAAPGLSPWMIGSIAFRRDLIEATGYFRPDMELCADLEVVLRMSAYGPVVWIDEPLLDYTVRGDSATSTFVVRDLERNRPTTMGERAWLAALTLHEDRRPVGDDEVAAIHDAIARQLLQRALWHRTNPAGKGRGASLRDFYRAARYSPHTLTSPGRVAVLLGTILAPKWVIEKSRRIGHRKGVTFA